jgi:hypothetical protein
LSIKVFDTPRGYAVVSNRNRSIEIEYCIRFSANFLEEFYEDAFINGHLTSVDHGIVAGNTCRAYFVGLEEVVDGAAVLASGYLKLCEVNK